MINISISALDTEMSESDKLRLFPACGSLFPAGQAELARCTSWEEIQIVIRTYASSCPHFWRLRSVESGSLDKVRCALFDIVLSQYWIRCYVRSSPNYVTVLS